MSAQAARSTNPIINETQLEPQATAAQVGAARNEFVIAGLRRRRQQVAAAERCSTSESRARRSITWAHIRAIYSSAQSVTGESARVRLRTRIARSRSRGVQGRELGERRRCNRSRTAQIIPWRCPSSPVRARATPLTPAHFQLSDESTRAPPQEPSSSANLEI